MLRLPASALFASVIISSVFGSSAFALSSTYICTAKDLFSNRSFTQSGTTLSQARTEALSECQAKTGETCVVTCRNDDISGGADKLKSYCISTDDTQRTWTAVGSSLSQARAEAVESCEEEAGVNCRISRCGFTQ